MLRSCITQVTMVTVFTNSAWKKTWEGKGEKLRQLSREKSACVRSYMCRFLSRLVVGLFHFSAICILNYFQSFNSSLEKVLDIPPFFVISSMASYFFWQRERISRTLRSFQFSSPSYGLLFLFTSFPSSGFRREGALRVGRS